MKKILSFIVTFTLLTVITSQVYGATYNYHYDPNGRLTQIESTTGRYYYEYDPNGNLIKKEVKDPLGFGVLDSPATDKIYTNTVTVRGWYLDKAGVESIKVHVNNVLIGTAIYGENREDVYAAYPNFNNHNAGFYYNLELPKENKNYTLKVIIRNNKGEETVFTKSFAQIVLQPRGEINYPLENGIVPYYINAKFVPFRISCSKRRLCVS
ncbi:RHS repeat domain-containing protein [Paenibacillus ihumii]|uniref:RHS repeat domain-containing protein n=1 Tax=Paenibacillus ihumii TaxID=687436 RepID=UPI0006D7DC91|nr:RHS repeat domain-containing protein [Paenibacillus ihumii]